MSKGMPVEAKLILSKHFPPGTSNVKFGRYQIQPVPLSSETEVEAILSFINTYEDPKDGSHPEEEVNIVCSILSLFLESRIKKVGIRINKVDIPIFKNRERAQYPQFFGVFNNTKVENYLKRVLSLDEDLARQFIRACRTYSFALEFIPSDHTFAFFLLVVAVECLSSQKRIIPSSKINPNFKFKRFCHFIISFLPEEYKGNVEHDDTLFKELLKMVYNFHRSAFVHGGKEVSPATLMADRAKSSYFKHVIKGKEVKTPGLGWFAKITRGAILGYLISIPTPSDDCIDEELFSRLANEKAGLNVKLKVDIEKGRFVPLNDIEYT